MRALFVCHDYPPLCTGGYPQLCHDVAQGLRSRGHEIVVLTSRADSGRPFEETEPVIRALHREVDFESHVPPYLQHLVRYRRRQQANIAAFDRVLEDAAPDIVLIWPSESLCKSLLLFAEARNDLTVAYYLAGYSPPEPGALERYWRIPAKHPLKQWPKTLAGWVLQFAGLTHRVAIQLELEHVMCVSEHERRRAVQTGVPECSTHVVYNGIDVADFAFVGLPSRRRSNGRALRLLYAGRLCWDKGAHTAVQAVADLVNLRGERGLWLTLVGAGPRDYLQYLDTLIAETSLSEYVELRPWVPRSVMPKFMAQFDVLVLPTIREEPLARVVQEAMAMGLVVIGTPTGGTPEILIPDQNGLCFPPEDAQTLARQIRRLMVDVELCDRLVLNAREHVLKCFSIDRTVQRIEELLKTWIHVSSEEATQPCTSHMC